MADGKFKIEKGVPLPAKPGGAASKYPFGEMEPGDSVLIPVESRVKISSALTYRQTRYNEKFATRVVDGGIRVWRVA